MTHVLLILAWSAATIAGEPSARRQDIIEAQNVTALQEEPEDAGTGRYDWGPSVMLKDGLYRMWWVRLGGANQRRFPYAGDLPDGERFEFTYPDRGDRIYYAESRDGAKWQIGGEDYGGEPETFGPESRGPMLVLAPAETDLQRMHLGNPSVIEVNGTYYMYFEACAVFDLKRDATGKPAVGDEYHNQVFVATSKDGKRWTQYPDNESPQPIVPAPESNKSPGRRRYGLGQPSVCYRDGTFIMHYVDSCTAPGDFIVRVEADNPYFRGARPFKRSLSSIDPGVKCPPGAVARFAQTDVKYLENSWCLLRPAYGTGRIGLLASRDGLFAEDAAHLHPKDVFPQLDVPDARGPAYRERLYPRFLTDAHGQIVIRSGRIAVYYASGLGFKDKAYTWDLQRCEVPAGLHRASHDRR